MAWQLEEKPQTTQQLSPQDPLSTRILGEVKRIGSGAGLGALKGLESIFIDIPGLFGIQPPPLPGETTPAPRPSELIQQLSGKPPEYFEPQSLPEQFLQRFSTFAPLTATGGLGGLGRTAVGSGIATGLGAFGAPESVQDIAQLGAELGTGFLGGRIPSMRQVQKTEDALARAAVGKNVQVRADAINDVLRNVEEGLSTETSQKYAKKINHAIAKISNNLTKESINPSKAMDLRASLYKLQQELPSNINAKYIQPLTQGINNFFATYASENPTFYKHLKARDQLTTLRHMNGLASRFTNALQLNKLPGGEVVTTIVNKITDEGERFLRGILSNPAARKYYFDAISATAKDNPILFIKNMNNLGNYIPGFEKSSPEVSLPEQTGWVLE